MKLTLVERKTEVPGVESFIFKPEHALSWKAGQFLHAILPHEREDDRGHERWFTIASAPFEGRPMITTRFTPETGSSFKKTLAALKIGDSFESDYVDGDFTIEDVTRPYVFIAGGIGITPFHSILKEADRAGVKLSVNLIYANRDEHIVYKDELEGFARNNSGLAIHYVMNPQRVDEATVRALVPDLSTPYFYVSGPEPMVKSIQAMLVSSGVPAELVKIDDFPGYETH